MSYSPSIIGSLVFPGRKSPLPAWTVPEYPAQAYPSLNYPGSEYNQSTALLNSVLEHTPLPANYNIPTNSIFNTGTNGFVAQQSYNPYLGGLSGLSLPNPLDSTYTNPFTSTDSLLLDSLSSQSSDSSLLNQLLGLLSLNKTEDSATTTTPIEVDTTTTTVESKKKTQKAKKAKAKKAKKVKKAKTKKTKVVTEQNTTSGINSDITTITNPLGISDLFGNQIPVNNALVQEGLFGNVHGVASILSRYVGDLMPTDKDAPGYTWKYTLPNQGN